jgi:hypothetical protein
MMGSEERGVPICFTSFGACALWLQTLNEIALPIVPTGTIPSAGAECSMWLISSGCNDGGRPGGWIGQLCAAEAEVSFVDPHAV